MAMAFKFLNMTIRNLEAATPVIEVQYRVGPTEYPNLSKYGEFFHDYTTLTASEKTALASILTKLQTTINTREGI